MSTFLNSLNLHPKTNNYYFQHTFQFKRDYTIQQMKTEADRIMSKHPDRIPVVVEKNISSSLPKLEKSKYLVPKDLNVGQFVYFIRKKLAEKGNMSNEQALFLFVENTIPNSNQKMSDLYEKHKDNTGFLFISYNSENTFG